MSKPNFATATIWTQDNLLVLRGLNSDSVDLIYLDPPFNSNRNYAAPVGSKAAGAHFKDAWTLDDVDEAWIGLLADTAPPVAALLEAAGTIHGKSMQSYLTYMAVRLLEMRRVLKPTGSIYLHCDSNAAHYLKLLMDAVFGRSAFRAAITWKRHSGHGDSSTFGNVADCLLFYGSAANMGAVKVPHSAERLKDYKYDDDDGRGVYATFTMANPIACPRMFDWQGYAAPRTGWLYSAETMDELEAQGRIRHPALRTNQPRRKRYLRELGGQAPSNIWTDILPIASRSRERLGYPTQKPLALLERIIRASSREGDVVLDPFCGTATTCVAAEKLGRRWVGIDLSSKAVELANMRLRETLDDVGRLCVTARTDIPRRTDLDEPLHRDDVRHILYGRQEGKCAGCQHHFEFRNLTNDRIVPGRDGGEYHISNMQLLCNHCNSVKGARDMAYLLSRLKELGIR